MRMYNCIYMNKVACFLYLCDVANRAKNIKTKAVVNESPTDRLIRELTEENRRLMQMLNKGNMLSDNSEDGIFLFFQIS